MSIEETVEVDRIIDRVDHALRENRKFGRITGLEIIPLFTAIAGILTQVLSACGERNIKSAASEMADNPGGSRTRRNIKQLARKLRKQRKKDVESALKDELDDSQFWTNEARNALEAAAENPGELMELHTSIQELNDTDGEI